METLLFHPKLVHLPIALGVLMPLVAGGLWLAWWRSWLPSRAWLMAIALQGILVASSVVALRTGEHEEERVERVVPEAALETHEEAAEAFTFGAAGVLAAMIFAAGLGSRRAARPIALAATLGTFVVLGLGYRTGQAGGRLVYEHGAASAYVDPAGSPSASARGDADED